jgi:predicted transcriptional regulator
MIDLERRIDNRIINAMEVLREKGFSYNRIARILRMNVASVYYYLNPESKAYRKRKMLEYYKRRYREDEKFRRCILLASAKQRIKAEELAKVYPEYAEVVEEYKSYLKNKGRNFEEAYKIFKEKVLKLREKYKVKFPLNVGAPWTW